MLADATLRTASAPRKRDPIPLLYTGYADVGVELRGRLSATKDKLQTHRVLTRPKQSISLLSEFYRELLGM